jgi:2-hydroxychromene-2-carboxylate isomerase
MLGQAGWIGPLGKATDAQKARWTVKGAAGRRAIANDFGFYKIMERRGYNRAAADRCLADEAMATRLAETSARDWKRPGITGTPGFAINGNVLPGTHNWAALQQQLKEYL